ncbi:hypothetical protein GOZ89_15490 [Agrobacterium vitis]|uniref:hypothetical protein n=1 Tax=Agrobacterium vitis TaxID=373 RepID=UPI0012E7CF91|nr:hypothetical protein [Agrobacterium vitis]MCF1454229.1 hypothetical protein [Agrobacterium vitis]MCF1466579.1 hypothetical protein [Agrobacterium vitis]MVA80828.1 hypothetical protein [Agrobacterium vitis]BCH55123.1 hypothetical protein RvVAR031_27330 [Agrobacterium vitis]
MKNLIFAFAVSVVSVMQCAYSMATAEERRPNEACPPAPFSNKKDVPWQLSALLSIDCFTADSRMPEEQRLKFAMDFGYPSFVLKTAEQDEAIAAIGAVAKEGDRGFFSADPYIEAAIDSQPKSEDAEFVRDFLHSAKSASKFFQSGEINENFLYTLPLWNNPENIKLLTNWCARNKCEGEKRECPQRISIKDKIEIAVGKISLEDVYRLCDISFEWIRELRLAGLIDTQCTSTMQINKVMANPDSIGKPCYQADFSNKEKFLLTSADAARSLRDSINQGNKNLYNLEELDKIKTYYPEIAEYLSKNVISQGKE